MKQFQKWIAMLLSVILLCNMLPMQIFAEEIRENTAATNAAASGTSSFSAEPAYIVGELEAERTAYSKEFLMSDGLHMAVLYPTAVHYETDNGWQEIDNTLVSSGDAYTNTANSWTASFPKTLTAASPVSVTRDGHTVSFTLSGELRLEWGDLQLQGGLMGNSQPIVQTSQAQIESAGLDTQAAEHPETVVTTLNSRLRYENVYAGTHLVYDLGPGQVKESIVLEQYSEALRGYCYTLNTGDLIPVLQEDGSIYLFTRDSEEPLMTMPAPYLEDHGGVTSYDVEVTLTPGKDGYLLTYQLPQAWLASADRQWPVILDPVIEAESSFTNIQDITVYENYLAYPAYYMGGVLECGRMNTSGISRAFLKFVNLPSLTSSDVIVEAGLRMYKPSDSKGATIVEIHEVNSTWDSQSVTWNNQPQYEAAVEDYANVHKAGFYSWNITDIARNWYVEGNTGLAITVPPEELQQNYEIAKQFYSSDFGTDVRFKPAVYIKFRNNNGLEGYWDYTSASAGRAGTGAVNNFTGNLTWVRSDMGFGGNRMPVSISHVYNLNDINDLPDDDNNSNDSGANAFAMGVGWRTNFNQLVYRWNVDSNYYVWEDADGTDHYFYKGTDDKYHHENNEKIILTVNGSGAETYCIEDETGNTTWFDAQGRLSKISNNQQTKSHITVAYKTETGKQIQTVTDGVGRVYHYNYDQTSGLLTSIQYKGADGQVHYTVSYGYTGQQLTSVTDNDGKTCAYAYDTNNCLISAQDIDGYKLSYTYNTVSAAWQPWRVQSISESDGNAQGSLLTFSYGHNQTVLTDHNGLQNILQFNDYGNVVSIQDGEGHAQFAQYAINTQQEANQNTDASARKNQLRLSSKLQNTVGNLLQNTADFSAWLPIGGAALAAGEAMLHGSSLQVTSNAISGGAASPVFTVAANETVTFSAYVKNPNAAAKLAFCGADLGILAESETIPASDAWIRTQVTYTNNTNAAIELKACFFGSGSLDHVQVEKAQTASRYNLLENGDFRFGLAGWTGNPGSIVTASSAAAPTLEAAAYSITGSPDAQKRLTQTLAISGAKDDSYVLTGWAMGNSVPLRDNRRFGLSVTFLNGETEVNECYVQFNPDMDASNGWQYAACPAVATGSYTDIRVSLCYDYNANTVYFDGIQLYKEQFGVSYAYDTNGNVKSVTDLQQQETQYIYDEADPAKLIGQKLPTGEELTYTYDTWYNVTKAEHKAKAEGEAEASVKQTYTFGYDTWGNNTSVTISTASGSITSSAAYTTDGNYMASATDALGNTVTYGYNAQTGLLEWTQYPGDSEAQRTEYTYDAMFRMATSVMDVDGNGTDDLSAAYTYENDLLTSIQTPSTTYSFSYGAFSLRTEVKVGNRTLASYSYTDDQNRYLEKMTYGNGDCVEYTYDELGRLASQKYNDNDTVTYSYDNDGALARVHDSATGITTTYYYDLLGRQMKYVESGTGYTHSVGYAYDAENNLSGTVERINGTDYATSYTYDAENRLTSVTANGTTKEYTYDDLNRVTAMVTKRDGQTVLTEAYTFTPGAEGGTTSQVATYTVTAGESVTVYTYTYDKKGNILSVNDGTNTTSYAYDAANQLLRENNQAGGFTHTWEYDNAGNILSRKEYAYTTGELGAVIDTISYGYGDASWGDLLTSYDGSTITYDAIGNPLNDGKWSYEWEHGRQLASMSEVWHPELEITAHPESYTGETGGTAVFSVEANGASSYQWQYSNNGGSAWWSSSMEGSTTASISVQATEARAGNLYRCKITDASGNIAYSDPAQINLGGSYDLAILTNPRYYTGAFGHMAVFGISARGEEITYQWQYSNNGGNAWWNSTMDGSDTPYMSVAFTEARQNYLYRCRITNAEGTTRYSAPAGFYLAEYTWNFTYNSDGMRTGRTDGETTYSYIYNGSKLSQMTVGSNTLTFAYDANGKPMTVTLNGTVYYYTTNLQGDVTGILDASGNQVATYTYDAWGNVTVASNHAIATLNPLTYRGYVYDLETELYYLQSRYYDPQIGRFFNIDVIFDLDVGIQGYNILLYCGDNPVCRIDISGKDSEIIEDPDLVDDEPHEYGGGGLVGSHSGGGGVVGSHSGGGIWSSLMRTFEAAKNGLQMASGTHNGYQTHHILSDKHSIYTDEYKVLAEKYNTNLNEDWNLVDLDQHCGRHTESYHRFVQKAAYEIDRTAMGDPSLFREGFSLLSDFLRDNPWIPYAR